MKKIYLSLLLCTAFLVFSCSKDDGGDSSPVNYVFVNNGDGGVPSVTDSEDSQSLEVVQAIPEVENTDYSKTIPIILFFNDKLYLESLEDNFEVTQNGNKIGGTVSINEGANGFAILTFAPSEPLNAGATIVLNMDGVQDDGGNTFADGTYSLSYVTNNETGGTFDANGGFESQTAGVLFLGDGNIMTGAQGCVSAFEGNSFAAITNGDQLISAGAAIGGASSMMVLGSINEDISSVSFQYNFLSAEFQEFVDSVYDDSVIVTVIGTAGAHSEFLTSVNTVGTPNNTECLGFPSMPDNGDAYAGETGWISKTINFSNVGSPAYIIFTVSDVSDQIYSSVVAVDAITFE